jgi:hypothetical protein
MKTIDLLRLASMVTMVFNKNDSARERNKAMQNIEEPIYIAARPGFSIIAGSAFTAIRKV